MSYVLPVQAYLHDTWKAAANTVVTCGGGPWLGEPGLLSVDEGVMRLRELMRKSRMTFMAGNGGSLALAAHMATDFNLAGLRTTALTDVVAATSHANDFGVEAIFTKQLEWYAQANDTLILMSCSGNSPNVIDAALYAQAQGIHIVSFTGFDPGKNKLRPLADLDFFVTEKQYGFVQLAHEMILHAACDMEAWKVKQEA